MQPTETNSAPWVFPLAFASDISQVVKGGQDLFTPSSSIANGMQGQVGNNVKAPSTWTMLVLADTVVIKHEMNRVKLNE